jgi:rhodanese-related sulfurtransferase
MDITPEDALNLINNNPELFIIDVSNMYDAGHIPGALNFPWGDGSFEAAVPSWDKDAKYLIYCHGDPPAIAAAQLLIDEGFENVYRLEGNYGAWVAAGYEVEISGYMDVTPTQALDLINNNPGIFIIDVSNMWEFGHLPGALDFPLGDGSFEAAIPTWDPNAMYLVYCHTDAASMTASQLLIDAGFNMVYRLEGNYGAWIDAGYEIEVETYKDISAAELYQMMMDYPDLIVIDVSPAYANGHIPGAVNYYVGDGTLDYTIPYLDPYAKYVVYCHGDPPAMLGAQKLIDAGFYFVSRLEGNYGAWVDAGYDVEVGVSNVTIVHASPDAPEVWVLVDMVNLGAGLEYPDYFTNVTFNPGNRNVKVNVSGTTTTVIEADIEFMPEMNYSLFAMNDVANIEPLFIEDDLSAPAAGNAHARFIHLSPDAPAVDITLTDGTVLFGDYEFKEYADFTPFPADTYGLQVRLAGTTTVVLELPDIMLEDGMIYTIFAKGFVNGTGAEQLGAEIIVNN